MAEYKSRPPVGEVRVNVGPIARTGANLSDLARAQMWQLKRDRGWSQDLTATRVGLSQTHVAKILSESAPVGLSLESLSSVCAALDCTPDALLGIGKSRPLDSLDLLRSVLSADEARRLEAALSHAALSGSLDYTLELIERLTRSAESPA